MSSTQRAVALFSLSDPGRPTYFFFVPPGSDKKAIKRQCAVPGGELIMHTTRCIMRPRCLLWVHTQYKLALGYYCAARHREQIQRRISLRQLLPVFAQLVTLSRCHAESKRQRAPAAQRSNLRPDALHGNENTRGRFQLEEAHCSNILYVSAFGN